jgi:glycosyltransferase involved in cell wall biosynthesis
MYPPNSFPPDPVWGDRRVAISHDWLLNRRGAERLLKVLLSGTPSTSLYTLFFEPGSIDSAFLHHRVVVSKLNRLPRVSRYYRYLLPLFPAGIESLQVKDAELLISIHHSVAKGIPHQPSAFHICYCLTPMRYLWEPTIYGAALSGSWRGTLMRLLSRNLKAWDLEVNHRVDRFVAISRTIQDRIKAVYGRSSDLIYPGADLDFFQPTNCKRESFYLIVSALVPQKRVDIAVEAFRKNGKSLRVAGTGPLKRSLERMAGPNTRFLGWVSDDELRDLYRSARALIFPGFEDFGLVPVEAQACGCPVIGLGHGGLTETVAEPQSGVFFEEPTAVALLDAVERFERRRFHACEVRRTVEKFSIPRFHEEWRNYLQGAGS